MRNKKQPESAPTLEQMAVEKHVEAIMNPAQPDAPVPEATIDIFKGVPDSRLPVAAITSAPEVLSKPTKPTKSLFTSIDALKPDTSVPVTVRSKPIGVNQPAAEPSTTIVPPKVGPAGPMLVNKQSLGANSPDATTVVTVDRLARRDEYADAVTDSAVADIVSKEGDELLEAQDIIRQRPVNPVAQKTKPGDGLRKILTSKWLLVVIPLAIIGLAGVPYTRYKLAGLVFKQTVSVSVVDSKTAKPVSGASVIYGDANAKTNGNGLVKLKVPVGNHQLRITKGYYVSYSQNNMVAFSMAAPTQIKLVATGRQVPLTIVNAVTAKPLSGVMLRVLGTSAISDANGKFSIVLPAKTTTAAATLSADGYNTTKVTITITDSVVSANKLSLAPSGSVYFLSKDDGIINVVKTNLDGTGRHVVLAGTGKEEASTQLSESRDWRYVVVQTRRDGTQTGLYLIDTTTDKLTQFDTSASTYTPIGWSGHTFVYDVVKTSQLQNQSGRESLKSYNADQQQLNQLDQNQTAGTSGSYGYQSFTKFYIVDGTIVYNTEWFSGTNSSPAFDLASQTNSIRTVGVDGKAKKDGQMYAASSSVQSTRTLPSTIDYGVSDGTTTTYYSFNNGLVAVDAGVTAATFTKTYPSYLQSPDSSKTFWSEPKGNRQTLQLAGKNAASPSPLLSNSEYDAYGWYGSQYLLLSRAGGALYIIPVTGIVANSSPVKISNYYQPAQSVVSYGGGF